MIYEFTFKNFRSYRGETTMSFVSKNLSEFEESLIEGVDEKLVPVCAIYGPNGGGKSSVLMALRYVTSILVLPFINVNKGFKIQEDGGDTTDNLKELERKWSMPPTREYYMWDENGDIIPSEFSILFERNNIKYKYEIAVTDNSIIKENLYCQKGDEYETIFERDHGDISYGEMIQLPQDININDNISFLVYIGMLMKVPEVDETISFFWDISYNNFDNGKRDSKYPMQKIIDNKDRILKAVRNMGIPIYDIRAEYDESGRIVKVYTSHKDKNGEMKEIDFIKESGGTRKIFSFIYDFMLALDRGMLVVADELDAKLHPALLQTIISWFTDKKYNKNGAQLLFTSHDITTMCKEIFRRDEIWFAALNADDESFLYSLADFRKNDGKKPRKDETYSKQYMEGRYGADPYLQRFNSWEEQSEFKTTKEERPKKSSRKTKSKETN